MTKIRHAVALALASLSLPAAAMDFTLGNGIEGKLNATATFGTMIRTESPDPAVLGPLSAARVGLPPGQLFANTGGNDLNFQKNRPVSTVLKAMVDLELNWQNLGLFARAKAWHDFELKDGDRAYGNIPNGFSQNVPLSDSGFDPAAKFSNARLADVYAFGKFNLGGDAILDARVGRQVLNWGVSRFVTGGIDAINARDIPAQVRPGALTQESRVPVGMIYANLAGSKGWGVDAFVQYEFRPTVLPPCGTFFAIANYAATGCNYTSVLGNLNDPTALATGRYSHQVAVVNARDSGQYGVSLRYSASELSTEFRGYAMNYHSRTPFIHGINPNIAGGFGDLATTRLTDPNGLRYALKYAEDIRLYGLSFDTRLDPSARVFGEVAYRPNQPLGLNSTDTIIAFLVRSPTSALNLARNTNAIPPGGEVDLYDRFKVTTASLGASKELPKILGVGRLTLVGELGWSHVDGLPDAGVLRYGRGDAYGAAAVNGVACIDTSAAQKSCALDGFVTTNAWGYRFRLSANYPGAFLWCNAHSFVSVYP